MALVAETGGADPARLRDVEDDPIRAAVLHLDVAAMAAALSHPERLVDVVAERRAGLCQLLGNGLEALDLEADVVDATVALATLDPGHLVVLEVEDRQVEVAVAQVVARGTRAVDPGDLLHAERSEEHTSELQSHSDLVCRLLLEKKKLNNIRTATTV